MQGVGFRPVRLPAGGRARPGRVRAERLPRRAARGRGRRRRPSTRFLARLPDEAPPLAVDRAACVAEEREPIGHAGFEILESPQAGVADARGHARHGDLRRLPARAVRPGRPPLPLPVHQLHQLRPAVHDRPRRALRPAVDDDGRLPDVRPLPGRVRRPGRPPLPRPAQRLPRLRAVAARCCGRRTGLPSRAATRWRGAVRGAAGRPRSWRSRASAATTWPAGPTTRPPSPRCGRASTARTSRSR